MGRKELFLLGPLAQGSTDRPATVNGIPKDSRVNTRTEHFLHADQFDEKRLNSIWNLNKGSGCRSKSITQMALKWVIRDGCGRFRF